jgi:transcriptional regulator with XRE-family HTH domain
MQKQTISEAQRLLAELRATKLGSVKSHRLVKQLAQILGPPRSLDAILAKVPGSSLPEKAAAIGITRQGLWCLVQGSRTPNTETVKKLAAATGVPVETILANCPR